MEKPLPINVSALLKEVGEGDSGLIRRTKELKEKAKGIFDNYGALDKIEVQYLFAGASQGSRIVDTRVLPEVDRNFAGEKVTFEIKEDFSRTDRDLDVEGYTMSVTMKKQEPECEGEREYFELFNLKYPVVKNWKGKRIENMQEFDTVESLLNLIEESLLEQKQTQEE